MFGDHREENNSSSIIIARDCCCCCYFYFARISDRGGRKYSGAPYNHFLGWRASLIIILSMLSLTCAPGRLLISQNAPETALFASVSQWYSHRAGNADGRVALLHMCAAAAVGPAGIDVAREFQFCTPLPPPKASLSLSARKRGLQPVLYIYHAVRRVYIGGERERDASGAFPGSSLSISSGNKSSLRIVVFDSA